MKFVFDWEDIPRPQRSGFISVVVCYLLVCAPFYARLVATEGVPHSWRDYLCYMMPWECVQNEQSTAIKSAKVIEWFQPIVVYPGARGKGCACYSQIRITWKNEEYDSDVPYTCDSIPPDFKSWHLVFRFDKDGGIEEDGRWRYHCIGGKEPRK